MQGRTRRKVNAPAWQIEYANAYRKYLKNFRLLQLNNYEPISFQKFVVFHTWQELNRPLKKKLEKLSLQEGK